MYRILYVDDEPGLLEIGKIYLENDGAFTIDTSLSAREALSHLKSAAYDAIVSDYQMLEMDGITFLQTLRASGNTTPFIIFTGKGREDVVIEALNSGADFYLQKGGDPTAQFAELAHKLHHAISRRRADLALEKSERDYRNLIEHANEAIHVIQDGVLRMVNPRTVEMSGYPETELLGQPFTEFIHPDDRGMMANRFKRRIGGEAVPSRYTYRILRRDGTIRWVEVSVVVVTWDGRPATLNFVTDITKRKHAEDALRESEERYRQFFRTTVDSVFITAPDGHWIDFNDAVLEMFGCNSREEVFSRPITSFYIHPEERPVLVERVEREGYVKEYPIQFRKQDGTVFDSLMTVVPDKNPDGSTKAFIGTIRDITEQKRTGDALKESEERYRHIFESFEDLYYQTDINGFVTILSPSVYRLTGYREGELIGEQVTKLYVNPEDRKILLEVIAKTGYVRDYEVLLKTRDGKDTPVSLSANRIYHTDGTPAGVAGIIRDISRRKHAEMALRESEEKFRSLVDYALEAILILDLSGTVLFVNNAGARMIEIDTNAELADRNVMEFIAPESREDVMRDFEQVARGHDAFLARYYLITAKGRRITVESIGKIITYEGRPADLISLRNVTVPEGH
jgi:PAS domain S-box-containing protein